MSLPIRQKIIKEIQLSLGGGMIDLDLDPDHYDFAVDSALDRYRQRSGNALEESFLFLDVQPEVSTYTLPQEVQIVRDIYRRGLGGGGGAIDPFQQAYITQMYTITNTGGAGGLATYDFAMQQQELVGRMFGRDIQYTWNAQTKKIFLQRKLSANEEIVLHVYNVRPEESLLADPYAKPWLRDYALAKCKIMLGEARSKFASLAGPQGGITLNGSEMKQEGMADLERLEQEIFQLVDQSEGYGFIIG